jgi:ketose-bisphosphate aldolase
MSYVSIDKILRQTQGKGYAVGAFNIIDLLSMRAVVRAASELDSPLIIQTSASSTVKYWRYTVLPSMVKTLIQNISVPVAMHLDHCTELEMIKNCIDHGWSSVMIDGSALPFKENIELTQKVVKMAHARKISVEGELGPIGKAEDKISSEEHKARLTDPDMAKEFVERTGVDAFAPAIGTAHGLYRGKPKLDFDRLKAIQRRVNVPIVIHGGTGLDRETFDELITQGACKINISTQIKVSYIDSLNTYISEHPKEHDPLKLIKFVEEKIVQKVKELIGWFGSSSKA